jgi:hypothetical protein
MSRTPTEDAQAVRRGPRVVLIVVSAVVVVAVLAGAIVVLYARGGGPLPEWAAFLRPGGAEVLAPSGPAETVLRTLRLAGYQHAIVGDAGGTVVLRIEVPAVRGPADVGLTWQTGMAAAITAYPRASRIVVQVFSPTQALVEVAADAGAVAAAVKADDASALRRSSTVRYLSEAGGG